MTETTQDSNQLVDYEAILAKEREAMKEQVGAPPSNKIKMQNKQFVMPDGTTHPGPMNVVILDFVSYNAMYEGQYNPNDIQPPACFAIGKNKAEMAPSPNATNPQSDKCSTCPKNEFGSDPAGGKGKACKNKYRLAVIPGDFAEKDQSEIEIMTLEVSPTAVSSFDTFANRLNRMFGAVPTEFVTEIKFNPGKTFSSLLFDPVQPHGRPDIAMPLRETAQDMLWAEPS